MICPSACPATAAARQSSSAITAMLELGMQITSGSVCSTCMTACWLLPVMSCLRRLPAEVELSSLYSVGHCLLPQESVLGDLLSSTLSQLNSNLP